MGNAKQRLCLTREPVIPHTSYEIYCGRDIDGLTKQCYNDFNNFNNFSVCLAGVCICLHCSCHAGLNRRNRSLAYLIYFNSRQQPRVV